MKTNWSLGEDEVLREGYAKGLTLREIGAGLGRSKDSVVSRAIRLGLERRAPEQPTRTGAGGWAWRRSSPLRPMAVPLPPKVCQWIEGDPLEGMDRDGNAAVCGGPLVPGRPWCAKHDAMARGRRGIDDAVEEAEDEGHDGSGPDGE